MDVWKLIQNIFKELPPMDFKAQLRPLAFFFLLYWILYIAVDNYQFAKYLMGFGSPTPFSFSAKALVHGLFLSGLILIGKALATHLKDIEKDSMKWKRTFLMSLGIGFIFIYLLFGIFSILSMGKGSDGLASPLLAAIVGTIVLGVLGWGIEQG